jgi:hypothetical protein
METKSKIQEKRKYLKALSNGLKILKNEGAIKTVNGGLKALYARQGHTELKNPAAVECRRETDRKGESALLLRAKSEKINTHNPAGRPDRHGRRRERNGLFPGMFYIFKPAVTGSLSMEKLPKYVICRRTQNTCRVLI